MKKFKKVSLLLVGLILVFSLAGCNSKVDEPNTDIIETPQDGVGNEDITDPLDDNTIEGDVEDPMGNTNDLAAMDGMIESSDYISKIKVITASGDNRKIEVLENIKKDLSPEDLPELANLEENKTYLVFMKDQDNTIVLTDEVEGVVPLENENTDLFETIKEKLNNL